MWLVFTYKEFALTLWPCTFPAAQRKAMLLSAGSWQDKHPAFASPHQHSFYCSHWKFLRWSAGECPFQLKPFRDSDSLEALPSKSNQWIIKRKKLALSNHEEDTWVALLALHTWLIHIYNALLHLNAYFCDLFPIYFQKRSPGLPAQRELHEKKLWVGS